MGMNSNGQLGHNDFVDKRIPFLIPFMRSPNDDEVFVADVEVKNKTAIKQNLDETIVADVSKIEDKKNDSNIFNLVTLQLV